MGRFEARLRGRAALLATAAIGVWAIVSFPLLTGDRTLVFRDVFTTHLHLEAFGAEELAAGRVPAVDPGWGLGQPFRGNPNTLSFYPGNLLYLILPFWTAFNGHYALHWLLAGAGFFLLARRLGQSSVAAFVAATAWAGGGWILTALSFYNLLTVSAWWPIAMWGAARGGRRGLAVGGLACGLALLGGEPFLALLGIVPLAAAGAHGRSGWRAGFRQGALRRALPIGLLGVLVATPQAVASLRILGFTVRGALGSGAGSSLVYGVPPFRWLELLLPLPWGRPDALGELGFGAVGIFPGPPYLLSLSVGTVAFVLALVAARRHSVWAGIAVSGALLAWIGTTWSGVLPAVSGGLLRYPAKLWLWPALALPLLAGWGIDTVRNRPRTVAVWLGVSAVIGGALIVAGLSADLGASSLGSFPVLRDLWIVPLGAAALALALGARLASRRSPAGIAAVHLGLLVVLHLPLLITDDLEPYADPGGFLAGLEPGTPVLSTSLHPSLIGARIDWDLPSPDVRQLTRLGALHADFPVGRVHGLTYPLAPDLEGLQSPYLAAVGYGFDDLDWARRLHWLRWLGVSRLVVPAFDAPAGLPVLDRRRDFGVETLLLELPDPAPRAWWPESVLPVESPAGAYAATSATPDPRARVTVPRPVEHTAGGRVEILEESPDRIELDVSGPGGLVVLRRAWLPIYRARAGDAPIDLLPAGLVLLGVEVPPGEHRVVVDVPAWPEALAGATAILVAAVLGWIAWRDRSPSNGPAERRDEPEALPGHEGRAGPSPVMEGTSRS